MRVLHENTAKETTKFTTKSLNLNYLSCWRLYGCKSFALCVATCRRLQEEEQQVRPASLPAIPNPFHDICSPTGSPKLGPGSLPPPSDMHVWTFYVLYLVLSCDWAVYSQHKFSISMLLCSGVCWSLKDGKLIVGYKHKCDSLVNTSFWCRLLEETGEHGVKPCWHWNTPGPSYCQAEFNYKVPSQQIDYKIR